MMRRIDSLQALRFFAAIMVAALHIQQAGRTLDGLPIYGGFLSNTGSFGVDVFFVLSGFIIAKTASGKSPSQFLRLRLSRVVPFYWLLTAAYLPFASQAGALTWGSLAATLTFYPPFGQPILHVGWTLCFEMLFYLVTAWTLYRPQVFVPLALIAFALCWCLREAIGGPFGFFGNPLILEFLAGVLIARVNYRSAWVGGAAAAAGAASLLFIGCKGIGPVNAVAYLVNGDLALQRVIWVGLPAACVVYAALQVQLKRGLLSHLGDASYSLYLVHPIVIAALISLLPKLSGYVFVPVALGLSIVAAVAAHRWIEQPLIAALRRPRAALAVT